VGVGRAGRARASAISEDPHSELTALSRGRFAGQFFVPDIGFDALLARVEAVAICSPNECHVAQVGAALAAGCHTVVEFPLAPSAGQAKQLFAQAHAAGVLLHVEHIELLLAWHRTLKERVKGPFEVAMRMTKKGTGRESFEAMRGALVARLHNLSGLSPIDAVVAVSCTPGLLELELKLVQGTAHFTLEYGPALGRETELDLRDDTTLWRVRQHRLYRDQQAIDLPVLDRSLFAQDHHRFMAQLKHNAAPYVSADQVVAVLAHVDTIAAAALVQR